MSKPQLITLSGSFYDMGKQYTQLYGTQILKQIQLIEQELQPEALEDNNKLQVTINHLLPIIHQAYPKEIQDFFCGMASSDFSKQNNLTKFDFVKLDNTVPLSLINPKVIPPEFMKAPDACSYFVLIDPVTKEFCSGRNFDWPKAALKALNTYPVALKLTCNEPNYSNTVYSIGYIGQISGFTLFNNQSLSWSLNSASQALPGCLRPEIPSICSKTIIELFKTNSYEEFKTSLLNTCTNYPIFMNISGKNIDQLATIEASNIESISFGKKSPFTNLIRDKTSEETNSPFTANGYIQTNTAHLTLWEKITNEPLKTQTISFSKERNENLLALVNDTTNYPSLGKRATFILNSNLDGSSDTKTFGATKLGNMRGEYANDFVTTYYQTKYNHRKNEVTIRVQEPESAKFSEKLKFTLN